MGRVQLFQGCRPTTRVLLTTALLGVPGTLGSMEFLEVI